LKRIEESRRKNQEERIKKKEERVKRIDLRKLNRKNPLVPTNIFVRNKRIFYSFFELKPVSFYSLLFPLLS
jgi:hypothetical protein